MSLTYQSERWTAIEGEIRGLVKAHWSEVEDLGDGIPFDPDYDLYANQDQAGMLHFTTMRDSGRLVGYYINIIGHHPHYRGSLFAFLDSFFLLPEYRRGTAGIRLFRVMEQSMRGLGVQKMTAVSTFKRDVSPLFRRLGWKPVETTFTKVLGG
jgi:GNAT superfamily N-acetyltransferase